MKIKNKKNKTISIKNSKNVTINLEDCEQFTINIYDGTQFTINVNRHSNQYTINDLKSCIDLGSGVKMFKGGIAR